MRAFAAVVLLGVAWSTASVALADDDPAVVTLDAVPRIAAKPVGLLWTDSAEFAPATGETHAFRVAVERASSVTLEVLSPDGDVVRRLADDRALAAGEHTLAWDGRDDRGRVVPDEAWTPRLRVVEPDRIVLDDPAGYSGGEILPNLEWTRRRGTKIAYELPHPARVLIRVGIEDGPMVRELEHWTPVDAGRAVVRWDGHDADGVDRVADRDDLWTVVMAYRLAEFAVITRGNDTRDYRAWRATRGNAVQAAPHLADAPLERRGVRLSRDYFLPRGYLPRVSLEFAEPLERSRFGPPVVTDDALLLRVDVPDEDRWILDASFYETGFYIDYAFRSEEEQGFVPMVWSVDTDSLAPGRHLATVQLFGFGGFIASDTVEFLVERP